MYNQRQRFISPSHQTRSQFQSSPIHQSRPQFQCSPIAHGNNHFQNRSSPYSGSPVYNHQANMHLPRHKSPYNPAHASLSSSFNNSLSSPEQWNRSNASYNSNDSSSSNYSHISQFSPYNSPQHKNSRSPYSQNRNSRFQVRHLEVANDYAMFLVKMLPKLKIYYIIFFPL